MATNDVHEGVPPPLQDIPTAREKKYDRQLRLWGAPGQIALEESHVLLINNGPGVTGVETLKNLVLPGIGQFSILDPAIVSEADLGVNFFLEDSSLGRFRAEETVKYLRELNPVVQGHAITEPLATFVAKDAVFTNYSLILISAPIDSAVLSLIQAHVQSLQIPTFYFHCVGFFSSFSLFLPTAFPIVETHPDPNATTDLRLLVPWPALSNFAKEGTAELGTDLISQRDKGHIPYLVLLLYYLERWRETHDGKVPETYKEKQAFRDMVRAGDANEENFDEACANVLKTLNPPTVPSSVRDILSAPEAQDITTTSAPFWVIAHCILQFYRKYKQLPLPGSVPDMKAESATYVNLQNIYKSKARQDFQEVLASVRALEETTQRPAHSCINEKAVENFCKGAAHIHLVRGRPFHIPTVGKQITFGDRARALATQLTNSESSIGVYIAFLAWDEYVATHATSPSDTGGVGLKVPGSFDSEVVTDSKKVGGIARKIVDDLLREAGEFLDEPEYSAVLANIDNISTELTRAAGGELHNVASLTGGAIAQEIIKVITKQYVPVDNTWLFDGVASKTSVLRV